MGRLIAGLSVLIGWSCFATVVSLAIVVGYALSKGYLDPEKLEQMAAIAHGIEMVTKREAERLAAAPASTEKASLEAIEMRRAAIAANMELRENMVRDMVNEFKKLQRALEEEKDRFGQIVSAYENRLEKDKERAVAEGRRQFQSIVESMKPKQAKEQLLLKYKENKIDVVVEAMKNMEETKRAKVLAEFKTPEDQDILAKILENIRNPGVTAVNETLNELKTPRQGP
ncbi:MAG: hypothetical protein DCC68_14060 [Planctomycetota bacterium]|nr:MAG: hypothetical protein DCC68_14060 [Planctomycetota bacterium]